MKSICIKSNNKYIIDYLLKDFSNMNLDCTYISNHTFKLYNNVIIHYKGKDTSIFYTYLCDILARCIIFFYEKKIIQNSINYNYFYFTDIEKKKISNLCIDSLNTELSVYKEKYNLLFNLIKQYITEHHSILLTGFVNFRIKPYKELIEENVDTCVSNFLIEREYYEFINILRLYVSSKESEIEHVHLIYINNESILIDNEKNIISVEDNIFNAKYLSDISFSSNDYCLNTLLNILPKKLTIHLISNYEDEFINTLRLIFENRVSICSDCDICRVYRLTSNVALKD